MILKHDDVILMTVSVRQHVRMKYVFLVDLIQVFVDEDVLQLLLFHH
jgi:hypothetical protein